MVDTGPGRHPEGRLVGLRARWAVVLAIVAVMAAAVLTVVVLADEDERAGTAPLPTPTVTQPGHTVTTTVAPTPTSASTSTVPGRRTFRYQPLWPFSSEADAAEWQNAYRTDGRQPWHLDPAQTALSFTTGFLQFEEINLVVSRSVRGDEATVAVGYRAETNAPSVAAVIHLARLGQGTDAPWEVVGTRDSTLTLEQPRYGAVAGSPVTVGGRITGVDEAIRVDVRQASSARPLGTFCCVPAGGERQPWTARVPFRTAADPVIVIVASTGGHYQGVESFAVTAIRAAD